MERKLPCIDVWCYYETKTRTLTDIDQLSCNPHYLAALRTIMHTSLLLLHHTETHTHILAYLPTHSNLRVASANNKKHPETLLIALPSTSLSEDCILPTENQRKDEIQLGKRKRESEE